MQSRLPKHHRQRGHRKAGRADTRRRNLQIVLDLVASSSTTTRADIARTTGLTRATVSTLVGELIGDDLVVEVGRGESIGGKPPTLIELNRNGRHLVAIDLSSDPFSGTIVDLSGRAVGERISAEQSAVGEHQANLERLIIRLIGSTDRPLVGVAVASPGVITDDGVIVEASNLDWHDHPLADLTSEACGLPVTIVNDAQAAAITAYSRLSADRSDGESPLLDLIFLGIGGAGVGSGIILGGRTHHGSHRAAGEIGHTVLDPSGPRCHCGNQGCLETLVSGSAIYSRFAGHKPANDQWSVDQAKANYGDDVVEATLAEAGAAIGSAFSILVNALDVSLLAISMQPAGAAQSVARALEESLRTRILAALRPDLQVTVVDGDDLSLLGAAAVVLNQEFGLSWPMPSSTG